MVRLQIWSICNSSKYWIVYEYQSNRGICRLKVNKHDSVYRNKTYKSLYREHWPVYDDYTIMCVVIGEIIFVYDNLTFST